MPDPSRPLRIVAIDDERLALRRVEQALAAIGGVELVGAALNGREGLELVRLTAPDVVLLDVEMSSLDGFQVLGAMPREQRPQVIFVTAFEDYAVRAFEVAAVDLVLTPVNYDRLGAALGRARARRDANAPATPQLANGNDFWALSRGVRIRVPSAEVEWLESERDYVRLHTRRGAFLIRGPLTSVLTTFPTGEFLRIRRSAAVRASSVISIVQRKEGDCRVTLASGKELRVGSTYLTQIQRVFRSPRL